MKPSERIIELVNFWTDKCKDWDSSKVLLAAISQYLDEQAERSSAS